MLEKSFPQSARPTLQNVFFNTHSKRASQRTARKGVNTRFLGRFCRIIGKVVGRFLLQNFDIKRRIMTVSVRKMDFLSLLKL